MVAHCHVRVDDGGELTVPIPRVILLDHLAQVIEDISTEDGLDLPQLLAEVLNPPNRSHETGDEGIAGKRIFAVGGLGLMASGAFDRYATGDSIFQGLARLCPRLRPVFDWLDDGRRVPCGKTGGSDSNAAHKTWLENVFVVCDSLPPSILEECLRLQSERPVEMHGDGARRPVTLFVMESVEMPDAMTTSFPPDVQLRLGVREEIEGKRTRTIQLLKSRFQQINDEPHPFVVLDKSRSGDAAESRIVDVDYNYAILFKKQ